jgi:hypothetical protein
LATKIANGCVLVAPPKEQQYRVALNEFLEVTDPVGGGWKSRSENRADYFAMIRAGAYDRPYFVQKIVRTTM